MRPTALRRSPARCCSEKTDQIVATQVDDRGPLVTIAPVVMTSLFPTTLITAPWRISGKDDCAEVILGVGMACDGAPGCAAIEIQHPDVRDVGHAVGRVAGDVKHLATDDRQAASPARRWQRWKLGPRVIERVVAEATES